ncbi:MAG: NAD(P)-dependent oxidoreductase [Bacteroidota bacterium]|nr:NAD(P)-dependent oxidoreductase [Bacteroidota bacterium]
MKIGVIREGKVPTDKRVALTPIQCKEIQTRYNNVSIYVQSSNIRCFKDSEYLKLGIDVKEDISFCDIFIGVKEVPIDMLIEKKIYFFFSHTIKMQPYNKNLLKEIIKKNIQLVDYETLLDEDNNRIIGFGRYAGIVGAYNTFMTYGKKTGLYEIPFAHKLEGKSELDNLLSTITLPNDTRILLTGKGRVSSGVLEVLRLMNIRSVDKQEYLKSKIKKPVYLQLDFSEYYIDEKNNNFEVNFFKNPQNYKSILNKYLDKSDIFIAGHFHASENPNLITRDDLSKNHKTKVIGDISCDINGPIASTLRASTIDNPVYGYHKFEHNEVDFLDDSSIAIMAVDNLPCSLPKDSSNDFGKVFIDRILPDIIGDQSIINNASITKEGRLTDKYQYLSNYIL